MNGPARAGRRLRTRNEALNASQLVGPKQLDAERSDDDGSREKGEKEPSRASSRDEQGHAQCAEQSCRAEVRLQDGQADQWCGQTQGDGRAAPWRSIRAEYLGEDDEQRHFG